MTQNCKKKGEITYLSCDFFFLNVGGQPFFTSSINIFAFPIKWQYPRQRNGRNECIHLCAGHIPPLFQSLQSTSDNTDWLKHPCLAALVNRLHFDLPFLTTLNRLPFDLPFLTTLNRLPFDLPFLTTPNRLPFDLPFLTTPNRLPLICLFWQHWTGCLWFAFSDNTKQAALWFAFSDNTKQAALWFAFSDNTEQAAFDLPFLTTLNRLPFDLPFLTTLNRLPLICLFWQH